MNTKQETTQVTFTPGPWGVEIGEDKCFHQGNRVAITVSGIEDGEPYNVTIAELWPAGSDKDIIDARLIAAAPELLAALEAALPTLEYDVDAQIDMASTKEEKEAAERAQIVLDMARAAIAKAKGGGV